MVNGKIWLSSPTIHKEEMKFIKEAFEQNWVAPLGPNVNKFEKEMAAYIGVNAAAAMVSGTSALHCAVKLAGVNEKSIVLCSDLTFAATVNPVSYENGTQVFIDSERDTWNMDPKALEKALLKYNGVGNPKPAAVILAHLYGTPAKLDEIISICNKYEIPLIEDAAESLSATYKGKQTGSFGKWSAISFNGNKIITTSGGGMFLSDDVEAARKVRFWSTQAREPFPWYEHREIGYNYRMSNIVAGIGRGQLLHLNEHRDMKEKIYKIYKDGFKNLPLKMNPYLNETRPNFWLSCILLDKDIVDGTSGKWNKVTPEDIRVELDKHNIESRPIWKPMHLQPVYADREFISVNGDIGGEIFHRGLCLPSDIKMTEEEQRYVIKIIRNFFIKNKTQ